jgi:hypothetical protein
MTAWPPPRASALQKLQAPCAAQPRLGWPPWALCECASPPFHHILWFQPSHVLAVALAWWGPGMAVLLLLLQSVQARTQARIRLLHLLSDVHTITPAIGGIVGALSESVPSTSRIIAAIVQNQLLTQLPISISPRSESSWKSEARDVACIWLEAALHVLGNSMAWLHARLRAWFIPLRSSRTRILGCPGVTIPLTTATGQMGPETPTHHPGTEPGTSACVSRGALPLS